MVNLRRRLFKIESCE